MTTFIAKNIIKAGKVSVENGQNKYRVYFVNTHIYEKYREGVNAYLTKNGYTDLIVTD